MAGNFSYIQFDWRRTSSTLGFYVKIMPGQIHEVDHSIITPGLCLIHEADHIIITLGLRLDF